MSEQIEAVEKNIDDLGPSGFFEKHDVKFSVSELEEVPYNDFGSLQNELRSGQAIARTSPYGEGYPSGMFSLFAIPLQQRFASMVTISSFAAAIIGISLTIFADSWWWLLLVLLPFVALRRVKAIYTEALFEAIGASEKAFCFAFYGNVITLETPDGTIHSRGMAPL